MKIVNTALRRCVLLLATCGYAITGLADVSAGDTAQELRPQIERIMKEERVPGMALLVARDGKITWQAGLGFADAAKQVPITEQTLFRIGDISKGFVALAALMLQEQGKLKLTDTLEQWVPELAIENEWNATDPVRLVHLLEHTSGLADMSLMEFAYDASPTMPLNTALEVNASARKARWRPGSRAAYSNVGPALVARVIEKATGEQFEDFVSHHLFAPLQMTSATYFEPQIAFAGQHAPNGMTLLPYWHHLYRATGAVNASVQDMARYLSLLLNRGAVDGVQLLTPSSIERMERPETLAMVSLGVGVAPALGTLNTIEYGVHLRGHYGTVNGALAEMLYVPETRSGIVVMMNSMNPVARYRVLQLLQKYLAKDAVRTPPAEPASVDPELLTEYGGYYLEDSPSTERMRFITDLTKPMHVTFGPNGMLARNVVSGFTERWIAHTGRTFRQPTHSEPMLAMFRAQDGDIVMQSKWGTLRKVSAFRVLAPLVIGALCIFLMLSALVVGLIWAVRSLFVKRQNTVPRIVRLLPIVASALFFAIAVTMISATNLQSLWGPWGRAGLESIAALVAGIAFVVCSLVSVVSFLRYRHAAVHRFVYWHSALVSMACLTVAVYLVYWGAIGVPIWRM